MEQTPTRTPRDILSGRVAPLTVYGLPTLAILSTGFLGANWQTNTVVWPLAFLVMGVACLANALRCGRVHCWFTGPFFLLLAAASLLHGLRLLPLGSDGWQWLAKLFGIGGLGLYFVPEWIWGRYLGRRS